MHCDFVGVASIVIAKAEWLSWPWRSTDEEVLGGYELCYLVWRYIRQEVKCLSMMTAMYMKLTER